MNNIVNTTLQNVTDYFAGNELVNEVKPQQFTFLSKTEGAVTYNTFCYRHFSIHINPISNNFAKLRKTAIFVSNFIRA